MSNIIKIDDRTTSFKNDVTPINDANMNTLLNGIRANKDDIKDINTTINNLDSIYATDIQLTNSVNSITERINTEVSELDAQINSINNLLDTAEERTGLKVTTPILNIYPKIYFPATSSSTTSTTSFEIGSTIKVGFTANFDNGYYKYGCINVNTGQKYIKTRTDDYSTYTGVRLASYSITFNGVEKTGVEVPYGVTYMDTKLTITDTDSKSFSGKYSTSVANDIAPLSNLGRPIPEGKYGVINNYTVGGIGSYISGYKMGCFYGTVSTGIKKEDVNSTIIRNLSKSNGAYSSSKTYTINVPEGATMIIIACPATNVGPTKIMNTTVNADMTSLFVKTTGVNVGGADATSSSIGGYASAYNVWTYEPALPYQKTASITVTLG